MRTDLGSPKWVETTGGRLGGPERRHLIARIVGQLPASVVHRLRAEVWRHRRSKGSSHMEVGELPDGDVADLASQVCRLRLSPAFVNHSYRTWVFGTALAVHDEAEAELDAETFFVAAMLHDIGLADVNYRCCFTKAGVEEVNKLARVWRRPDLAVAAAAISDHITPGLSRKENVHGFYLQRGSLLDLTGIRSAYLPRDAVRDLFERYPDLDIRREGPARWRAESAVVKDGRAALLQRWGRFSLLARVSPLPP